MSVGMSSARTQRFVNGDAGWGRLTRHAGMGTISDWARTEAVEQRRERAREKVRDFIVVVVLAVVMDEPVSGKRR